MIEGQDLVGMTCIAPFGSCEGVVSHFNEDTELALVLFPEGSPTVCHFEWLRLQDEDGVYRVNSDEGWDWADVHTPNGDPCPPSPLLIYMRGEGYRP